MPKIHITGDKETCRQPTKMKGIPINMSKIGLLSAVPETRYNVSQCCDLLGYLEVTPLNRFT